MSTKPPASIDSIMNRPAITKVKISIWKRDRLAFASTPVPPGGGTSVSRPFRLISSFQIFHSTMKASTRR